MVLLVLPCFTLLYNNYSKDVSDEYRQETETESWAWRTENKLVMMSEIKL